MSDKEGGSKESGSNEGGGLGLEALLVREAGTMGRLQIRVMFLCFIVSLVGAFSTNEFVFTTGRLNTRCLIPECEDQSDDLEFSPPWILNAVPATESGFDGCLRFANTSLAGTPNDDTCPALWFDRQITKNCREFVFESTHTVVYDLGLACDEWRRSLIGSVRTFGALFSLPLAGLVSDRWGRRFTVAIFSFNTAWMGLLRYWSSNYIGFLISVFVESALGAGATLASGYILLMEMVPPKYRVPCGAFTNCGFALGQVMLGLLAWALPYWRHLTLALYAPQLLTLSFFWIYPESFRWCLSKCKYDAAEKALKHLAQTNKTEITDKSLEEIRQAAIEQNNKAALKQNGTEESPWLVVLIFQYKPMLVRCLVTPVWWITMTLVYYGLSINAVNISGNIYFNYMAVAAIEIPGFISAMFLNMNVGRKLVLMMAYWICAAGQIAYIFIPNDQYAISLTVYLISKYGISIVVSTLYLYTTELFPTRYRQTLFSYSSMMGRVGSIVAPLTPALGEVVWPQLPFALFAGFALLSGLLSLVTPETRGCRLPDSMQEASELGRKPKSSNAENVARFRTVE